MIAKKYIDGTACAVLDCTGPCIRCFWQLFLRYLFDEGKIGGPNDGESSNDRRQS